MGSMICSFKTVGKGFAWGDAWTNLLQPFWALPVLAIAGLKAKDIMGYCLIQLFISGAIINLLAPSGGGQWAVQGPVMVQAATEIGASQAATALAVQIGDQWSNMIQPFWILPVLAISGLKLRDVMGYMVLILIYLGIIYGSAMLIWGYLSA